MLIQPVSENQKLVYTFKQARELLADVSDKTLRRWAAEKKIKTVRLGARLKGIPASEIQRIAREGVQP